MMSSPQAVWHAHGTPYSLTQHVKGNWEGVFCCKSIDLSAEAFLRSSKSPHNIHNFSRSRRRVSSFLRRLDKNITLVKDSFLQHQRKRRTSQHPAWAETRPQLRWQTALCDFEVGPVRPLHLQRADRSAIPIRLGVMMSSLPHPPHCQSSRDDDSKQQRNRRYPVGKSRLHEQLCDI